MPFLRSFRSGVGSRPQGSARALMRSRARGALLGLALGDALGATVEFMTQREIVAKYGRHNRIRGEGWLHLAPGQVTDDTTMAFALAKAWLASESTPSAADVARAFDEWMRAKPIDIGNTVRRGIVHFRRSGEAQAPRSEDAGNGATMRCAPVALATLGAAPDAVTAAVLAQARITHHNPLTDAATLSVVAMTQAALSGGGIRAVMQLAHQLVSAFPQFRFRPRQSANPTGFIVDTMRVVLQCIDLCDNFQSILEEVVNRGGDADTTGAIAGTIAGALCGEDGLPARWLADLNPRVRAQCVELADGLIERAPAWRNA